ncbi:N-acetylmuramoyl-L-alanine amidase [Nocardia pneumoniae]|uniref:N-acetylmuramoyl-L-alanine amidase n=1 Tax=Nocardia pneumoniae TaxID=228601 RepID=UPI0002DD2019|nr:N-acetylmuramoyl-L-alanine amidase [Nocardia pneumoniae]
MKPSIIKAGICTTVTAAVTMTLSGLLPVTAQAVPASPDMANKLAGRTIFLDPGHQGSNHSENLARPVSDGRGGTKDCQTTGMATINGVPEHTITWNVGQMVKTALEGLGARVVLSRQDDTGWGGCIDERANAATQSGAAVAVSIHADSAPAEYRGFHLIVPELPIPNAVVNQVQSGAGLAASQAVRDAYRQAGFVSANYGGVADGLQTRKDVAGPALTAVPLVFLEMGNGANPEDAALLETPQGQLKHAIALTTGLVGYLLGTPQAGAPSDQSAVQAIPQPGTASDRPVGEQSTPQGQTIPGTPQGQSVPGVPQGQTIPGLPQSPSVPGLPQSPSVPGFPQSPSVPGFPQSPSVPGFPQSQTVPGSPQSQTVPGSPQSQTVPGTPQSQSTPGTGQSPSSPYSQQVPGFTVTPGSIVELLLPLAKSLGMDDSAVSAELINLAYTLAGMLLGPAK